MPRATGCGRSGAGGCLGQLHPGEDGSSPPWAFKDLVIVDTPDALLVAHRDQTQKVKDVVDSALAMGMSPPSCTAP